MSFPINPKLNDKHIENGIIFIFNGTGWIKESIFIETDPIYQKDKKDIVFLEKLNSEKELILQDVAKRQLSPTYKIGKKRSECVFKNGKISIFTNEIPNMIFSEIQPRYCIVQNSEGIHFTAPLVTYSSNNNLEIYLSDSKGLLSINSNFEFFEFHFDIINDSYINIYRNYDIQGILGRNTLNDESSGNVYHASMMKKIFKILFPDGNNWIKATLDFPLNNSLNASETIDFCVKNKINLILRPYVDGARMEQLGSNPDILTIASHYSNDANFRQDITPSDAEFLSNVIAVSAGLKLADTSVWTSYGFGVEFCETYDKADIDARYPTRGYYKDAAFVKTVPNDNTTITVTDPKYNNIAVLIDMRVGDKVYIDLTSGTVEATILNIVDPQTFKLDKDLGVIASALMNYYCTIGGSHKYTPAQSPTCAIVGAKFRIIQDKTNANWQLIREACRKTASNSTMQLVSGKKIYTEHWDMYRGFGIIDVDKAVEYIRENYSENTEYKESVVATMPKVNSLIGYKDLQPENYVPKSIVENLLKIAFAGRNLFLNSDTPEIVFENLVGYEGSTIIKSYEVINNVKCLRVKTSGGSSVLKTYMDIIQVKKGDVFSSSIYVENLHPSNKIIMNSNQGGISAEIEPLNKKRCLFENVVGDGIGNFHYQFRAEDHTRDLDFLIYRPKYQKGKYCDEWTPAPEDLGFNI